ncbi:MAG: DEAD/DEAH box helicase, partial [Candidatus Omnitrophica bacterium]|nr:DEAD/DEAH box helicase [Candidatus Omnitrophota bacterium]
AIASIEAGASVLVSAPTGSGKTLIAEEAIKQAMREGREVIYTAPIKALSNQKYRDFRADYGDPAVGIVTGDVAINPRAPILIMTTEIYRNTLFENPERFKNVSWVIFDEVHYLDDWERGTVWEESILFTPDHIELLCLSATVPNVQEIADWIRAVHGREVRVVEETHRPVPLKHLFQCQGKIYASWENLLEGGYQGVVNWRKFYRHRRRAEAPLPKPNRLDTLIHSICDQGHLPSIYFAFGRRQTETLARELKDFALNTGEERERILALYDSLVEKYDLTRDRTAAEMRGLVRNGIAYHHAGMLPTLKEVVEQLFTSRLIKIIFTTETFALGINMPARSVIFDELRKFYGMGFANLRTRDFYQMAGRAGRRGMDEEGYVYSRIHPNYMPITEVKRILMSENEPVRSQFNSSYATLLNLYQKYGQDLLDIYPRTLHHHQATQNGRSEALGLMQAKLKLLRKMQYIEDRGLLPKGEFASWMYGYELMMAELFASGWFDSLRAEELALTLSALIYEPRKGERVPHFNKAIRRLEHDVQLVNRQVYKLERDYRVRPYTKHAHFNIAPGIEAWMQGARFEDMGRFVFTDDGEIVRYFRMTLQLLRQLRNAPGVSDALKEKARVAIEKINRGVIDAERQLRA